MKCHVKDCENHDYQGLFIGIVCSPCYEFLSVGRGKTSQLYRNTIEAEREACANACNELHIFGMHQELQAATIDDCVAAIRARGQE